MNNESNNNSVGTVYDDVFRTMVTDSDELTVSFLNEMFNLGIKKGSKLVRYQNEVFLADESKRITDSNLSEQGKNIYYHVECESTDGDTSILFRIFEYDSAMALRRATYENEGFVIKYPMTGVLYLRDSGKVSDSLKMIIESPDGKNRMPIEVAVMKVTDYDLMSIFEKELYFLLPFYIFNYERELAKGIDEKTDDEIIECFQMIKEKLDATAKEETIDAFTRQLIARMINKVVSAVARKHIKVTKGVDEIMGGKVLDYPEKHILNRGREEGRAEGREEGREEGLEAGVKAVVELCKSYGGSSADAIEQIVASMGLSQAEADRLVSKYW